MSTTVEELLRDATSLYALSLWQPWAWAVAEAGKDVENRGWEPPRAAVGKALAIHAAITYDVAGAQSIHEAFGLQVPERLNCTRGAVVAVAVLVGHVRDSASRWAQKGQVQWRLNGTVHLSEPVPCKGAQGLWKLPENVFQQVRASACRITGPLVPGPGQIWVLRGRTPYEARVLGVNAHSVTYEWVSREGEPRSHDRADWHAAFRVRHQEQTR